MGRREGGRWALTREGIPVEIEIGPHVGQVSNLSGHLAPELAARQPEVTAHERQIPHLRRKGRGEGVCAQVQAREVGEEEKLRWNRPA